MSYRVGMRRNVSSIPPLSPFNYSGIFRATLPRTSVSHWPRMLKWKIHQLLAGLYM
jgi:hypothetical protein